MNIILTGKKHIGKSTLLKQILSTYTGSVSGFQTHFDERDNQESRSLYMTDLAGENRIRLVSWLHGIKHTDVDAFNSAGEALLSEKTDLIVMDELGILESHALRFRDAVHSAFESPQNVLAIVRMDARDWMGALKDRSDVVVFTVNETNRDTLSAEILNLLK